MLDKWEQWCSRRKEWQKWLLLPVAFILLPVVIAGLMIAEAVLALKDHIFDGGFNGSDNL